MRSKLLYDENGLRRFAVVFDKGDEVTNGLTDFARDNNVTAAAFTAIGAFSSVTLGYFDRDKMEYDRIPLDDQVEVLSLVGDIAEADGDPTVHAHVVVGRRDTTTAGGHLIEGHVWPTLEVIVTENPESLRKRKDRETGLALIDLSDAT